ncbi:MJ1255/VC2487 family glycosyltransferase [Gilvimarinus sp. F26214L]|uniref:MJ1255/VC2487 family glycosyltransferase n=1 Tax=Gilvimarinus sp. DZF01 TaxID=3461371 RepID=UPI004045D163
MKILYGVQGTGNGHITRARGMSRQLRAAGFQVDYVFSGRARDRYASMETFGDWRALEGLTFAVAAGRVRPLATLLNSRPLQLLRDIRDLPVEDYDLVISDFEPVSAWAARRRGVRCLGLGHQYAFDYPIPKLGDSFLTRTIMKKFAPASYSIGMHWYHYGQPIVPPIIDIVEEEQVKPDANKIVVYLPFEDANAIRDLLSGIPDFHFLCYGNFAEKETVGNLTFNPISRTAFLRDLSRCGGVISNAGFELASESISLGKKLLVKPLLGQMEQLSNALALQDLGLGRATLKLERPVIREWLENFEARRVRYPNVAKHIAAWIAEGDFSAPERLAGKLWAQTQGLEEVTASGSASIRRAPQAS